MRPSTTLKTQFRELVLLVGLVKKYSLTKILQLEFLELVPLKIEMIGLLQFNKYFKN